LRVRRWFNYTYRTEELRTHKIPRGEMRRMSKDWRYRYDCERSDRAFGGLPLVS